MSGAAPSGSNVAGSVSNASVLSVSSQLRWPSDRIKDSVKLLEEVRSERFFDMHVSIPRNSGKQSRAEQIIPAALASTVRRLSDEHKF